MVFYLYGFCEDFLRKKSYVSLLISFIFNILFQLPIIDKNISSLTSRKVKELGITYKFLLKNFKSPIHPNSECSLFDFWFFNWYQSWIQIDYLSYFLKN